MAPATRMAAITHRAVKRTFISQVAYPTRSHLYSRPHLSTAGPVISRITRVAQSATMLEFATWTVVSFRSLVMASGNSGGNANHDRKATKKPKVARSGFRQYCGVGSARLSSTHVARPALTGLLKLSRGRVYDLRFNGFKMGSDQRWEILKRGAALSSESCACFGVGGRKSWLVERKDDERPFSSTTDVFDLGERNFPIKTSRVGGDSGWSWERSC